MSRRGVGSEAYKIHEEALELNFIARPENTVISEWPWRFRPKGIAQEDRQDLLQLLASGCSGRTLRRVGSHQGIAELS